MFLFGSYNVTDDIALAKQNTALVFDSQRRTGHCGVLAIATWAAWFWAAQGRLVTKEKRKGRKKEKEKETKEKESKKKEESRDFRGQLCTTMLRANVICAIGLRFHCTIGPHS